MTDSLRYIQITDSLATAGQIDVEHLADLAAAGFKVVINNRPDNEVLGQPTNAELAVKAEELGLEYYFYPVNAYNYPGPDLESLKTLFEDPKPTLAFCRSGTRSTNLWINTKDPAEQDAARQHAHRLGYDVSMSLPR